MATPGEYNGRLKAAIKRSGRLQWWVARQAGISTFDLSRIVNGHIEATKENQQAIAKALRVKSTTLF